MSLIVVGRELAMFSTALFTSLGSNYVTIRLKKPSTDKDKKIQKCLGEKATELPLMADDTQRNIKYNALLRECQRQVGENNKSDKVTDIVYYSLLGGAAFTGVISGIPLFWVYYAFDKTDNRVRNGIIYAVFMTLINSLLLSIGRPTTNYELVIFSLLYAYIAMVTSAFFHEFY